MCLKGHSYEEPRDSWQMLVTYLELFLFAYYFKEEFLDSFTFVVIEN